MTLISPFTTEEQPELKTVGGKGLSLIVMTRQGFPVPPGFVLTTGFFAPWFEMLRKTPEWSRTLESSREKLKTNCEKLKKLCAGLKLDDRQNTLLEEAKADLRKTTDSRLLAVRSSSPEEDLEGASFAGGYETSLGVTEKILLAALRHSFASCLDERVFVYKKEHGFDVSNPNIAIVVQTQIPSETAGVAFSLNPLNNCYDEAVINANFGLGESVVSGRISPDQFVVDKVTGKILETKTGKKENSTWLLENGGTEESPASNRDQLCLTDEQVLKLTDMVTQIEKYYSKPMDIEWAFAAGKLYLLQARPVTAYIPLPEEMQTKPGENRTLYMDMLLIKQGFHDAFSIMGLDAMDYTAKAISRALMGSDLMMDLKEGMTGNAGGRTYVNVYNSMKIQGQKRFLWGISTQDSLAVEIIKNLNIKEYAPKIFPKKLKGLMWKIIFNSLGMIKAALKAFKNPEEYHLKFKEGSEALVKRIEEENRKELPIKQFTENICKIVVNYFTDLSLAMTYAAEIARAKLKRLFKKEKQTVRDKIIKLEQALPNNVTIEMGLAMYRLACDDIIKSYPDGRVFTAKLKSQKLPGAFLFDWNHFMKTYGHRCPKELDLATPRFHERPAEFFEQLKVMSEIGGGEQNPQSIFDKGVIERKNTFEELCKIISKKGKRKEKKFKKYYNILKTFGAYREIHKYYWIMIIDMIRQKARRAAESLTADGRLDRPEQVFDLNLADLDRGLKDSSLDLRAIADKNTVFLKKIKNIHNFPRVIDSRGKILHAPKKEAKEGEIAGQPISPGIIRGRVKVLHEPDEKPILPGEILVTRATDPGWTPLFINAGGIVLEVGGLLQHGALVAREYCKPCVAGIENITDILKDGQEIEMDGASGLVKILQ